MSDPTQATKKLTQAHHYTVVMKDIGKQRQGFGSICDKMDPLDISQWKINLMGTNNKFRNLNIHIQTFQKKLN